MRRVLVRLLLLFVTWCLVVAHLGVQVPPADDAERPGAETGSQWIPRAKAGLNHAVLVGDPYARGLAWGRFTQDLLEREEDALVERFRGFFPLAPARLAFLLFAKRWFWGISAYLDEEWLREMHGVAQSAPAKYAYLADPYTRQLALHALHEVGQMFVDYAPGDFGCTVLAYPHGGHWLVGRNFDFEGGRIFDEEKILKWVFPDKGIPFVSVIWAGMVGAVTGVNAHGVYISINAAGSSDFGRLGTPSTLILTKALQTATTASAAVEIFRVHKTIITEIFVVTGPGAPLYVIEKSPKRMHVAIHQDPTSVANHLLDPDWAGDKINEFRKRELTTLARYGRAEAILAEIAARAKADPKGLTRDGAAWILDGIRDKQVPNTKAAQLGNRQAIDALIATHAVVYDSARALLYVGVGPSLTGEFRGFDLAKSFAERIPVEIDSPLPSDSEVSAERYAAVKAQNELYLKTIARKDWRCEDTKDVRIHVSQGEENYLKAMALATLDEACGNRAGARLLWARALALSPAYKKERRLALEGTK